MAWCKHCERDVFAVFKEADDCTGKTVFCPDCGRRLPMGLTPTLECVRCHQDFVEPSGPDHLKPKLCPDCIPVREYVPVDVVDMMRRASLEAELDDE